MLTRRILLITGLAAAGGLPERSARALTAEPPLRLARILVGFPPGGSADVIGRALAERLRAGYATTVVVENKPGALGAVVMQALMSSEPDGSAVYLAPHSPGTLYPHLYEKLPFDPSDALPVSMVGTFDFALSVGADVPARTVPEFVQWCRDNPKQASYGSLGNGSSAHFLGFMLSQAAGFNWNHIPYKGAGPGVLDLLASSIPSLVGPLGDIVPHHRSGKVRILATSGAQRSRFMPEIPTFEELGFKGMVVMERFGVYVRKGTSAGVITRLNTEVVHAVGHPDFRAVLEKLSYEPRSSSAQEFDAIVKSETIRWGPVVRASGFKKE